MEEKELSIANCHGLKKKDNTPVRTAKEAVKAIYNSKMDGIESATQVLDHFTTCIDDATTLPRMTSYIANKLNIIHTEGL